jgi:hypothetical protein
MSVIKFLGLKKIRKSVRQSADQKPDMVIEQVKKVLEDRDQQLILMVRG